MYGKTQTYKTTTAKYFFDIYNQQNGTAFALEDLTSSEAALQSRILEFRDCVFILDDLSDGATNARTMRKKNTVDDFIRTAANCNSRLTKSGNSILGSVYDCSLAITAEYLLEIESSINRTILIDMEKHLLDENVLKFYAKHPLLPTHFSELFIGQAKILIIYVNL
jgi:hypothetical protein